ncbi:MAG: DUF58 domain-containing protein [Pseudomonadales bacterium]|nr:DUF58 domain-containing protein [Pseudomonadales bacterium]
MRARRPREPSTTRVQVKGGAYTDIKELIRLRYAVQEVDAITASKTRNPLSGLLTSHFRGRGIDFAEVRIYQPGDDVRTIDWRVTARTQTPHTKLFQEEKERPVLILVDQSQSMFFGSHVAFKSVVAAEAAALLAWTALDRGDRTGGIVFSQSAHREIRPRRNKHSVLRLLNEIANFNQALHRETPEDLDRAYLVDPLRNLRRVAKHGSTIFIVSDFAGFTDEAVVHFNYLARHNDIVGIHISDSLERDLPDPDLYTITNGEQRARINTADGRNRRLYHDAFSRRLEDTRNIFARAKSPLLELMTHEPVVASLATRYNEYLALER